MARIGLIQFDILWENPHGNIDRVSQLLESCEDQNFDLLILPELWICGFTMNLEAHKTFDQGHRAISASEDETLRIQTLRLPDFGRSAA